MGRRTLLHRGVRDSRYGSLLLRVVRQGRRLRGQRPLTSTLAAGAPDWVRGLSVNAEGNLVLDVKPKGTMIIVR